MRYTLLILFLFTGVLSAQQDTSAIKIKDSSVVCRDAFIRFGIGWNELLNFGMGVQFTPKISASLKYSLNWVSNGSLFENMGEGVGLRITYHNDIKYVNSFSFEISPYLSLPTDVENSRRLPFIKGYCVDLNVGKENIYTKTGAFYVACGVSYSVVQNQPSAFGPYFKFGWNYNLFFGGK